jgi:hypothetical protein
MEQNKRKSPVAQTSMLLMVAFIAFLFGGYVTKGSDWLVLVGTGGVLAFGILMLAREFWKPAALPSRRAPRRMSP